MAPGRVHRHRHRRGCFQSVFISEDNARFLLLVVILSLYLLLGTAIFYLLEHDEDEAKRKYYDELWRNFSAKYEHVIEKSDLDQLFQAGSLSYLPFQDRPAIDFYHSFYLAFTACTTIGFGHLVPCTTAGRAVMIVYGLFGCSAIILFYNLFLERTITLLALVLKSVHECKKRRREQKEGPNQQNRRDSSASQSSTDSLENWKPSVYWVMLCLFSLITIIILTAGAMFSSMEEWDYFTGLYFSFICFATIGFGDFVSGMRENYGPSDGLYRFVHFLIIIIGTSTLYSLFNVISIIIKHGLNFIIKKIDQQIMYQCRSFNKAAHAGLVNNRRNALVPTHARITQQHSSLDRRFSEDVINVSEFLHVNKVSLAIMQRDLQESAQRGRTGGGAHHSYNNHLHHLLQARARDPDFTPANIGPMAIVEHTLGEDV